MVIQSTVLSASLIILGPLDFLENLGKFAQACLEITAETAGKVINAAPELMEYIPSTRSTKAGLKLARELLDPRRPRLGAQSSARSRAASQFSRELRSEAKDEIKETLKGATIDYIAKGLALEPSIDVRIRLLEETEPLPPERAPVLERGPKPQGPAKHELVTTEARLRGYTVLASQVEAAMGEDFFLCDYVMRSPRRAVVCVEVKNGPYETLTAFQHKLGLGDGEVKSIILLGTTAEKAGLHIDRPLNIRTEVWCFNGSPACGGHSH